MYKIFSAVASGALAVIVTGLLVATTGAPRIAASVAPPRPAASATTIPGPPRKVTAPVHAPVPSQTTAVTYYTVASGDYLGTIAQKEYGTYSDWPLIWQANKSAIPNPDRLVVGTRLVIPAAGPVSPALLAAAISAEG